MKRWLLWGGAAVIVVLAALVFLAPYIAIALLTALSGGTLGLQEVMFGAACLFAVPVLWRRRFLPAFAWIALGGSAGAFFESAGLLPGADAGWLLLLAVIAWRGDRIAWAGPLLALIAATTHARRIGEFIWLSHSGESLLADAIVPVGAAMAGFATLTLVGVLIGLLLPRPRLLAAGAAVLALLHLLRLLH